MASFREIAVAAGLRASRNISGTPAVYARNSTTLSIPKASKKTLNHTTVDGGGSSIVREAIWGISVAEFGSMFPPTVGDTITDEVGTVFRVECPSDAELHWTYTDVGATEVTIYTRHASFLDSAGQSTIDLQGNEVRRA